MTKRIEEYTKQEFLNMAYTCCEVSNITQVVIVPLDERYEPESSYGRMKYILCDQAGPLAVAGGCSDALFFASDDLESRDVGVRMAVDHLMASGCIRLHSFGRYRYDGFPTSIVTLIKMK